MTPSTSDRSNGLPPFESSQPETTGTVALAPRDLSKAMSLFELDESLRLLLDSAWEAAEENNGEIPQELQQALLDYCEAFGEKVDNIADIFSGRRLPPECVRCPVPVSPHPGSRIAREQDDLQADTEQRRSIRRRSC